MYLKATLLDFYPTCDLLLNFLVEFILLLDGLVADLGRAGEGDDDDAHVVSTSLETVGKLTSEIEVMLKRATYKWNTVSTAM